MGRRKDFSRVVTGPANRAVRQLAEWRRRVARRLLLEGLPVDDVAEVLQLRPETVCKFVKRGLV